MATRFTLTICIAGLIFPITTLAESGAQVEIHYAPRENLENVDVQEIGRAELSIDMAAYVLSDPQIIEALTRRRRTRRGHPHLSRQVSIRRARTLSRGTRRSVARPSQRLRAGQGRGCFDALESVRRRRGGAADRFGQLFPLRALQSRQRSYPDC